MQFSTKHYLDRLSLSDDIFQIFRSPEYHFAVGLLIHILNMALLCVFAPVHVCPPAYFTFNTAKWILIKLSTTCQN
jgi:hypothetical protein